jgi:tight adherence protein C
MQGGISQSQALFELAVSLAAGLALFLLLLAVWFYLLRREPAWQRVEALTAPAQRGQQKSLGNQIKESVTKLLARLSGPAKPKGNWQESKLKKELMLAGFRAPGAVSVFLGTRVIGLVVFPALIMLSPLPGKLQPGHLPLALAFGAGVGYMIPAFVLQSKIGRRRDRISRELPDVLDLMVISVEAGLGLDAAIRRVADEVKISAPILAQEFTMVSLELKAGIPRDMALKNLATRCGVDEVGSLVSMLNQADRFGVSVGRSLRVHSQSVRTKRRQKMEEKAAKIPLKLLFPVLFMIFPAIMVVMAGPAIIRVSESILK